MKSNTHTHREAWLQDVVAALREPFKQRGYPIPDKVRVTCGFPSVRAIAARNTRIGECWSSTQSADEHHEIMVSPMIADSMKVAGILAHELVHAAVGLKHGHKGPFRKLALAIGLEGKMTSTTEGPAFKSLAAPILEAAGPYPHAGLDAMSNGRKKQTTRMIKCQCEECGYPVRVTQKWLDDVGPPHCPHHGEMTVG